VELDYGEAEENDLGGAAACGLAEIEVSGW
jgi:hypothetical protein